MENTAPLFVPFSIKWRADFTINMPFPYCTRGNTRITTPATSQDFCSEHRERCHKAVISISFLSSMAQACECRVHISSKFLQVWEVSPQQSEGHSKNIWKTDPENGGSWVMCVCFSSERIGGRGEGAIRRIIQENGKLSAQTITFTTLKTFIDPMRSGRTLGLAKKIET